MKKDESSEQMEEDDFVKVEKSDVPGAQDETIEVKSPTPDGAQVDPAPLPPLMQGENPPILDDNAGDAEDTGAAAGAEHPPDSRVAGAPQPSGVPDTVFPSASSSSSDLQSSETPRIPSTHRRDSESDQEKGLKRKLGDRTVSESLVTGDTVPGRNGTAVVGATKRPRDDPEADPNTREKKRPTPPPEEDEKPEKKIETPPATSTPQFVSALACFWRF